MERKKVTLLVELIVPVDATRDSNNLYTRLKAKVALNRAFFLAATGVENKWAGVEDIEVVKSELLDN